MQKVGSLNANLQRRALLARQRILGWYDQHRADWPWRAHRDPYSIWVAETMLQQTRLAVAARTYGDFLRRFPTIADLADAEPEQVLAAWSGLGYYNRARHLHRAAQLLVSTHGGCFPTKYSEARSLPGVGPYTAAAVLSIAFDKPYAAVDGNVRRVLRRFFALLPGESRQTFDELAALLLDRRRPGDWNQALMELGQTICTASRPRCSCCPVRRLCAWQRRPTSGAIPKAAPFKKLARIELPLFVVTNGGRRIVLERGRFPYLRTLWLPLSEPLDSSFKLGFDLKLVLCGRIRHAIVHRAFAIEVFRLELPSKLLRKLVQDAPAGSMRRVFSAEELGKIGRSSLLMKALATAGIQARVDPTP